MNQRIILVAAALTAAASLAASAAGARLQDAGILLREIKQNAAALAKAAPDARAALQERQTELQGKLAELKRGLPGGAWDRHEFMTPAHRKDRDGNDLQMSMIVWLPPDTPKIRGVFLTLWSTLVDDPYLRAGAREGGLAFARINGLDGGFNYTTGSPAALEEAFAKAAEVTGRPELRGAPIMTAGMSASVIGARNVAYWKPDRSLGVIHASGGNMHHCRYDPKRSLAGVPFLAVNGEVEACGPEGGGHMSGAAGIRPEYGFQTQWVMMRDSMIARQKEDPTHLMSILVMPNAGHGGWSDATAYVSGLFMAKAARYRLPGGYPDAKPTADGCVRIDPRLGWLTDANLKAPQFKPAPYDKYEGDPARAFWHFDEELALAVIEYHSDVFSRPDPAWGPLDVEAARAFNLSRSQGPEPALKALLALCGDQDDKRRAEAAGYIGRLAPAANGSIPRLIAMFGERPAPLVTESLAESLARLAPPSVQFLLDAAKHADPNVRAGAIAAFGRIGKPAETMLPAAWLTGQHAETFLAAAEAASGDKAPAVRRAALDTMMRMKAPAARIGAAAVPVLDDMATAGGGTTFSNTCFEVTLRGADAVAAVMPALLRAVTNADSAVFGSALDGILAHRPRPPAEAVAPLGESVLTSDTNRWAMAVAAIVRIDLGSATNLALACMTQLSNKDPVLADAALDLLGRLASKIGAPDFRVRSVRQLVRIVEGNGDTALRRRATRAIGAFGAEARVALPALRMAAEEGGLKDAAQKSLTDIGASGGPNLDAEMQ